MNVIQEIKRINERELEQGVTGKASWHHEYKDSAWVFAGGFPYDLTEGDILCVMSQWGEIEDINLCRDKDTGKSKGFCFIKYENQKSTILAVDNFNGIELLGRTIRVDHKHKYSLPAEVRERAEKEEAERLARGETPSEKGPQWRPGVAYEGKQLATSHNFHKGVDVFAGPEENSVSSGDSDGDGGKPGGEPVAAKNQRREAKRKRKEARERKRREKESSATGGGDGSHHKKKKKHHKKDKQDKKPDQQQGRSGPCDDEDRKRKRSDDPGASSGKRGDASAGRRRDYREGERQMGRGGGGGGADAEGTWDRGARAPGDGPTGNTAVSSSSQPASRAAAAVTPPQPLSTGNILDWRGLGGRGGGGGRGARGGRGGGRGGRDGGGRSGGRGSEGMNSMGGMDRRR